MNVNITEKLFTDAIAAEAEVSGTDFDIVATAWALDYADAALTVFMQYRPHNQNAPAVLRAARAWLRAGSPKALDEFNRARSRFWSRPGSGQQAAARHAVRAIIEGANAVNNAFPVDCLMLSAAALRESQLYAAQRPFPFAKGLPPCPL